LRWEVEVWRCCERGRPGGLEGQGGGTAKDEEADDEWEAEAHNSAM